MQLQMVAPILGVVGLVIAVLIYRFIVSQPAGNEKMQEIADAIHAGAMAFLKREYKVLAIFMVVVFVLMLLAPALGWRTGVAFLGGAFCSIFAGLFGMQAATKANVRTSEAARDKGIAAALMVSYSGGSVMGLAVASLGLIGVGIAYLVWGDTQKCPVHQRLCHGRFFHRPVCTGGWRHLHQGRRCGFRPGGQD